MHHNLIKSNYVFDRNFFEKNNQNFEWFNIEKNWNRELFFFRKMIVNKNNTNFNFWRFGEKNANTFRNKYLTIVKKWHVMKFWKIQKTWRKKYASLNKKSIYVDFCFLQCQKYQIFYWNVKIIFIIMLNIIINIDFIWSMFNCDKYFFSRFFHIYFMIDKKIIWRNMTIWSKIIWMKLSKSIAWWFENYDYKKYNWK